MASKSGGTGAETEMHPAASIEFVIDSEVGRVYPEPHALDRSLLVGAGTYTVKAQYVSIGATKFIVDDWSLIVEKAKA